VSEQYQWRQLGSIVNSVLLETRTKAIRAGAVAKPAPRPFAQRIAQPAALAGKALGAALPVKQAPETPAAEAPAQLELPFGIAAASNADFGKARSPRGIRLM
jgi:hypothetical protein